MGALYWISEYGKVFCGYCFFMFFWPSVVFRNHLKKKTLVYYFGFCTTVPIVIVNMIVLILGGLHILQQWIIMAIFYGMFTVSFLKNILLFIDLEYRNARKIQSPNIRSLRGKYKLAVTVYAFLISYFIYIKAASKYLLQKYKGEIKGYTYKKFLNRVKGYFTNSLVPVFKKHFFLFFVLAYGVVYFSYGVFQIRSYGYGELYAWHGQINGLLDGNILSLRTYSGALQCFIYCMNVLFGIRVYSSLLFLQGIHVLVFLVSVYLLFRQIFHWRYTPVFVLMLFLTLDLNSVDCINNMFRLQITGPMEFGLHTVCLCALFLAKYLHNEYTDTDAPKSFKLCWSENLFLFMMALTAAATTQIYVLIMSVIVCAAFAIFDLKKIFCRRCFFPLLIAAGCVAVIIMILADIAGIQGDLFKDLIGYIKGGEDWKADIIYIISNLSRIYTRGYAALYGGERGRCFLLLTVAVSELYLWIRRKKHFQYLRGGCLSYSPIILLSFLYILVYVAPAFGLADIIPDGRFFALGHMMILAVMFVPVDMLFSEMAAICKPSTMWRASFVTMAGIYGGIIALGGFRGYLFFEMTRYNAAVDVTNSIIDTYPEHSYTIVSPTDDIYQIVPYGWHEELLSFVEQCSGGEYTIPSENVFIYIEKRPIVYAQRHFFSGYSWFGEEKYSSKYPEDTTSQSPEIKASVITERTEIQEDMRMYDNPWEMYSQLDKRTILESMAYDWCRRFSEQHSSVLKVYYEDEDFVCYYFHQNTDEELYNLAVN